MKHETPQEDPQFALARQKSLALRRRLSIEIGDAIQEKHWAQLERDLAINEASDAVERVTKVEAERDALQARLAKLERDADGPTKR